MNHTTEDADSLAVSDSLRTAAFLEYRIAAATKQLGTEATGLKALRVALEAVRSAPSSSPTYLPIGGGLAIEADKTFAADHLAHRISETEARMKGLRAELATCRKAADALPKWSST